MTSHTSGSTVVRWPAEKRSNWTGCGSSDLMLSHHSLPVISVRALKIKRGKLGKTEPGKTGCFVVRFTFPTASMTQQASTVDINPLHASASAHTSQIVHCYTVAHLLQ